MIENFDDMDERNFGIFEPSRIAYIKPTLAEDARKMGIIPEGIKLPAGMKLYVLHAIDGHVLGFTDAWESAYGAAVQNDLTPMSVH